MIPLTLTEVAEATEGAFLAAPDGGGAVGGEVRVTAGVSTDSRSITAGALFAAVRGERVDGHDFLAQVFDSGAAGALVAQDFRGSNAHKNLLAVHPDADGRLIAVDDAIAALGRLARVSLARLRERGDVRVVGITGSVGKTSTKDLAAAVLRGDLPSDDPQIISPPGSFNNELGLPLTVLRATEATRVLVLEMGADNVGNIEYLTSIAPPDVAVVLAVARAHLGEFGGIEAVTKAKAEMVSGALPSATVLLNADDPRVAPMASQISVGPDGQPLDRPRRLVRFGRTFASSESQPGQGAAEGGVLRAVDIVLDEDGRPVFTLERDGEALGEVHLGLVGEHHVSNALAAAGIALALGLDAETVVARLSGVRAASPHRMDVTDRSDGVRVVDDAYNANPDSMRAALAAMESLGRSRTRRIAVLGTMLELGEESAAEHRAVGAQAALRGIDVLIAVGDYGEEYMNGAMDTGVRSFSGAAVPDLAEARRRLDAVVKPGDVVLFKGSNGSGIWRLAEEFAQGPEASAAAGGAN